MSFYNMLFGQNPNTDLVLALLDLRKTDIERLRDCGIDFAEKRIWVYTRTGGGNRADYPNLKLCGHPCHAGNYDDDGDSTYAHYNFKFPDALAADIEKLAEPREHGIPASIIRKVQEIAGRQEPQDVRQAQYEAQGRVVERVRDQVVIANGHTVVPLSDAAFAAIAAECEKADGEFMAYWWLRPYKINVGQNCRRWSFDANKPEIEAEMARVLVTLADPWAIDTDCWQRWKAKYAAKYPKTIARLDSEIGDEKQIEAQP